MRIATKLIDGVFSPVWLNAVVQCSKLDTVSSIVGLDAFVQSSRVVAELCTVVRELWVPSRSNIVVLRSCRLYCEDVDASEPTFVRGLLAIVPGSFCAL